MKKQSMTVAVLVALSVGAFGQGQVILANNASTLVRIDVPYLGFNGEPAPVGSMLFQLHAGPVGTSEYNLVSLTPIAGTSIIAEGRIANTVVDVWVVAPGQMATFQIWGWSSQFSTFEQAANFGGLLAKSILFNAPTSPYIEGYPPPLPVSLAGLYPGFSVVAIPEPSAWALLSFGGIAFFIISRLKNDSKERNPQNLKERSHKNHPTSRTEICRFNFPISN